MLGQDVSVACFFIDSPSGGDLSVRLDSKLVNFTESRIEIWNADLSRVPCPKNRCRATSGKRLLARLVNGRTGFRYTIQADVKEHEIPTPCSREGIPIWAGNSTFVMPCAFWEERFECDGQVLKEPLNAPAEDWIRGAVVIAAGAAIFALWIWEIVKKDLRERSAMNKEGGKKLRGEAQFEAALDVSWTEGEVG
jgi:hypothetical protein